MKSKLLPLFLQIIGGATIPMPNDRIIIPSTDDQISGLLSLDELPAHRTAAVILCLFYAVLLALAQGSYKIRPKYGVGNFSNKANIHR